MEAMLLPKVLWIIQIFLNDSLVLGGEGLFGRGLGGINLPA